MRIRTSHVIFCLVVFPQLFVACRCPDHKQYGAEVGEERVFWGESGLRSHYITEEVFLALMSMRDIDVRLRRQALLDHVSTNLKPGATSREVGEILRVGDWQVPFVGVFESGASSGSGPAIDVPAGAMLFNLDLWYERESVPPHSFVFTIVGVDPHEFEEDDANRFLRGEIEDKKIKIGEFVISYRIGSRVHLPLVEERFTAKGVGFSVKDISSESEMQGSPFKELRKAKN